MTCQDLCFVGDKCSCKTDSPECIKERADGMKGLVIKASGLDLCELIIAARRQGDGITP